MGIAIEGSAAAWPGAAGQPVLPEFDVFNQPARYVDIFNKGQTPFEFSATPSAPWMELSMTNGIVEKEQRLWVSVDWARAPKGSRDGFVKITGARQTRDCEGERFQSTETNARFIEGFRGSRWLCFDRSGALDEKNRRRFRPLGGNP